MSYAFSAAPARAHLPQLNLSQRKGLHARILFFEALARHELNMPVAPLANLKREVHYRTLEDPKGSPNAVSLDRFTKQFAEKIRRSPDYSQLQPVIDDVAAAADRIACRDCSTGAICEGSYELDNAIVATSKALCMRPFFDFFDLALATAKKYYSVLPVFEKLDSGHIRLSTQLLQSCPVDMPQPYGFTAKTRFEGSQARVQLQFCLDSFDVRSYLAVPYVLFHECICHAFQALAGTPEVRNNSDDDPFSEGWMDFIAYLIFSEVFRDDNPAFPTNLSAFPVQAWSDAGRDYHGQRKSLYGVRRAKHAIWYTLGTTAARQLHLLFRRLPETKADPIAPLCAISCDLNLHRCWQDNFSLFVTNMHKYLPDEPDRQNYLEIAKITPLIRSYLASSDARQLFNAVCQLP